MTRKQRQLSPKQQMDLRALSMLVDESKSFEIEDKDGNNVTYKLYPLQLGRLALITERLIHLDLILDDPETDVVKAMWEICADQPRKVAEIIAIATLRTKDDIDNHLEERVNELLWSPTMTPQALTNILYTIIFQSYHEDFMKAIRLVKILSVKISQEDRESLIATAVTPSGGKKTQSSRSTTGTGKR